jgi:predicted DNA-binding transcriptional regulator AlpA
VLDANGSRPFKLEHNTVKTQKHSEPIILPGAVAPRKTQYARAKNACAHFGISRSTLWAWSKARKDFPKPLKAGPKTTLFDITAIEVFLLSDAAKVAT